jgi:hypothetical protein
MPLSRKLYVRIVRPYVRTVLARQRIRLLWFLPGYAPLLRIRRTTFLDRIRLLTAFLTIDWSVEHAHRPSEITAVCCVLAERPARDGEVAVEAGCWRGGSTAKFSLMCRLTGHKLLVFDSFAGVQPLTA